MKRRLSGQVMIEFLVGIAIVVLPLSLLLCSWFYTQQKKTECALQVFRQARIQLLRTKHSVDRRLTCGPIQERIRLSSLEELDHDKGALGLGDLINQVSQLSEQLSSFSRSAPGRDSSESWDKPTI